MFEANTKENTLIMVSNQILYEALSEYYKENELVNVTNIKKEGFNEIELASKIKGGTLNYFIFDIIDEENMDIYFKVKLLCDTFKTNLFPVVIKKDNLINDEIKEHIALRHSILLVKENEITKSLDVLINSLNGSLISISKEELYDLKKEGIIITTFGESSEVYGVKCATELAIEKFKLISKKEPNNMIFLCEERTPNFINLLNVNDGLEALTNVFFHENIILSVSTNPNLDTEIRVSLVSLIE